MLIDTFGRTHNNLRISVTDRCNLRCTYCMPEEVVFMDRAELLTFEEMTHFVRVAAPLGIDKIRLTGGEPLLRRDLPRLVHMLAEVHGIKDVGLTTNGLLLANQAQALFDAGLRRINISLDTLDPGRFRAVSRRDGLDQVLAGIDAAQSAGFHPIKINAVSIRGLTDLDAVPLARYARDNGLEMRFIEYMPIGADAWERSKVYFAHEILEQIEHEVCSARSGRRLRSARPGDGFPVHRRRRQGRHHRLGIAALLHELQSCASDLRRQAANCLFALDEVDVKPLPARPAGRHPIGGSDSSERARKWEGHEINTARFIKPSRTMHTIGG